MPIYHLRRTATIQEFYAVQADTGDEAIETAGMDGDPYATEDVGDGEWDVYSVEADPEPVPGWTPADLPDSSAEAVGEVLRSLTTLRAFAGVQDELRALADRYDPATEETVR